MKKISLPVVISFALFVSFGYNMLNSTLMYKSISLVFITCALVYLFRNRKEISFSNPVVLSVSTYVVIAGISTLYANSGKFAIKEYAKILLAFAIFLIVVISTKKDKKAINTVLWASTTLGFLTAILTIDGATLGLISPIIENIIYGSNLIVCANWGGDRISSIFGNANVFATMLGVNLLLSLFLYIKEEKNKQKYIQALYLITQATAFLLAFSMGGTASLAVSVLALLIFAKNDIKFKGLIAILEVLMLSFAGVALTVGTYVKNEESGSFAPFLAIICAVILFILCDKFIGSKVVRFIEKYSKQAFFATIITVFVGVGFVIVAMTTTEPITLESGQSVLRTIYPSSEEYTININDNTQEIGFSIYAKTNEDIILNSNFYLGGNSDVSQEDSIKTIEITEDIKQVDIYITNNSENEVLIETATLISDEDIVDVPLKYTFLPENIVARIQGLRTNYSFITRLQYFSDSFLLFLQSPIIGHGLGGVENAIQSVQKYQYETKYTHNHFLQVMADMGIVGLAAYLFLLSSCVISLIKSRKHSDLSPVLFGALVMIIMHGANEISMSAGEFLPFAFSVFALIAVTSDVKIKKLEKYSNKILSGTMIAITLFLVLFAGNILANINMQTSVITLDVLERNIALDIYEKNDYKIGYVLNTSGDEDTSIANKRDRYLKSLEKAKSNTISLYLAGYYIENNNPEKSYEQILKYIDYSLYDPDTWNLAITQYISSLFSESNIEHFYQNREEYIKIIEDLIDKLNVTNQSTISKIELDNITIMNIRNIYASKDYESHEEFSTYVSCVIYDSKYDTSINNENSYDAVVYSSESFDIKGNVTNSGDSVRIKVPFTYYTVYKIQIESENVSQIKLPTQEVSFVTVEGATIALIDTNNISNMPDTTDGYVDVIIDFAGDDAYFGGIVISR